MSGLDVNSFKFSIDNNELVNGKSVNAGGELNISTVVNESNLSRVLAYVQLGDGDTASTGVVVLTNMGNNTWSGQVANTELGNQYKIKIVAIDDAENKTESAFYTVNLVVSKTALIQKVQL